MLLIPTVERCDFSVQGWTIRTSALLPVHRDDLLDAMVHSAPYGADLVVEVCRKEDDDWVHSQNGALCA